MTRGSCSGWEVWQGRRKEDRSYRVGTEEFLDSEVLVKMESRGSWCADEMDGLDRTGTLRAGPGLQVPSTGSTGGTVETGSE